MDMKKILISALLCAGLCWSVAAQTGQVTKETYTFEKYRAQPLHLDKYDVPSEQAKPCVIFMFGGGFVTGTRASRYNVPFFYFLAENGYTVVSIDYRLGMQPLLSGKRTGILDFLFLLFRTVRNAATDLFDATSYVLSRADEWNIDRDMIITCGSSAGAVSVLQGEYLICKQAGVAKKRLPHDFNYAGVISFAGAVLTMDREPRFKKSPCPVLLFHGDADSNVPYNSLLAAGGGFYGSKVIAGELRKRGYPYRFYTFENAAHEIAVTPMTDNREEIILFLDELVRDKRQVMEDVTVRDESKPDVKKDFKIKDFIRANFTQQAD